MPRILVSLSLLFALTACGGSDPVDSGSDSGTAAPDGAELYAGTCAACHGADGTGTSVGPNIARELGKTDAQLIRIILNGEDDMPAQSVSEEEAQAIVDWMRDNL